MQLDNALQDRQRHRRSVDGRCLACGDPHPCREWRLARAAVLVAVRHAFAAARRGERW